MYHKIQYNYLQPIFQWDEGISPFGANTLVAEMFKHFH
jgi:hypothetical protein